jgi:plastocyanin
MKPWCAAALALCWPAAAVSAAEHHVLIDGMAFTPRVVRARPGDIIVWTNKDLFVHNVTADKGEMRSGELQPGQAWRYTVRAGPAIDYRCTLHPTMTARIAAAASPKGK